MSSESGSSFFHYLRIGLSALVLALASQPGVAIADSDNIWPVKPKLLGKPKEDGISDKSKDVSGMACATASGFPRLCLVADDESQGVQIAILHDGKMVAGDFIRLIYNQFNGKLVELDAEAVAFADGYFYVAGSHGRPRHENAEDKEAKNKAKGEASRHLFRIRVDPSKVDSEGKLLGGVEVKPSTGLTTLLRDEAEIRPSFDRALEDNGLTIEGIAARNGNLYVGLRGPLLSDGKAGVLSVPLAALFDGQQGTAKLAHVDLGKKRGVRDLVAVDTGFLVLAGPVNDPEDDKVRDGDYSVIWWDGEQQTKSLGDVQSYGKKVKPEALVPLDHSSGKLRVLLLFDGPEEGAPRTIKVDQP
jgi:hypothetical protein